MPPPACRPPPPQAGEDAKTICDSPVPRWGKERSILTLCRSPQRADRWRRGVLSDMAARFCEGLERKNYGHSGGGSSLSEPYERSQDRTRSYETPRPSSSDNLPALTASMKAASFGPGSATETDLTME